MALTVVATSGLFDPETRDKMSIAKVLKLAMFGESNFPTGTALQAGGSTLTTAQALKVKRLRTAQTMLARSMGRAAADFTVKATTTDNSAASQVLDLTDQGVTFPAGTRRKITFRSIAVTDNDQWEQEWEQYVLGGTTPALMGSAKLINAIGNINGTHCQYGDIAAQATYSGDTATSVTANCTAGSSLGNNSTNTVTLTHPIARAAPKNFSAQPQRAAAAVAGARTVDIIAATATTATAFISDLATPTAAAPSGTLSVFGYIVPPPSVALVMNSNNVEVHCGHDASDVVTHYVEVYIGRAENIATIAD